MYMELLSWETEELIEHIRKYWQVVSAWRASQNQHSYVKKRL